MFLVIFEHGKEENRKAKDSNAFIEQELALRHNLLRITIRRQEAQNVVTTSQCEFI